MFVLQVEGKKEIRKKTNQCTNNYYWQTTYNIAIVISKDYMDIILPNLICKYFLFVSCCLYKHQAGML